MLCVVKFCRYWQMQDVMYIQLEYQIFIAVKDQLCLTYLTLPVLHPTSCNHWSDFLYSFAFGNVMCGNDTAFMDCFAPLMHLRLIFFSWHDSSFLFIAEKYYIVSMYLVCLSIHLFEDFCLFTVCGDCE